MTVLHGMESLLFLHLILIQQGNVIIKNRYKFLHVFDIHLQYTHIRYTCVSAVMDSRIGIKHFEVSFSNCQ